MRKSITKSPVFTSVPGQAPIELIAYYDEFSNYYPQCEMATKRWLVENVGRDWLILDCGANIGYFTILFAHLACEGHVYAFEPTKTYDMLLANLAHHKIKNVTPLKLAVGKQSGLQEDKIFRIWGARPERKIYTFTTIDDFIQRYHLTRIDCIKVDVDSFDFEVLQGARNTLIKYNPFVIVELNHALNQRGQSDMQAIEWLCSLGYEEALVLDYDNFLLKCGTNYDKHRVNLQKISILFEQPE